MGHLRFRMVLYINCRRTTTWGEIYRREPFSHALLFAWLPPQRNLNRAMVWRSPLPTFKPLNAVGKTRMLPLPNALGRNHGEIEDRGMTHFAIVINL